MNTQQALITSVNFNMLQKSIRAKVIRQHLEAAGLPLKVVCFSCGNSVRHLRSEGLSVVYVGAQGDLAPGRWFTYSEIAHAFNGMFDATSGHLPWPIMVRIAARMRAHLTHVCGWPADAAFALDVPAGSGETMVCLRLAFPNLRIRPVYSTEPGLPTTYSEDAPLNGLVHLLKVV